MSDSFPPPVPLSTHVTNFVTDPELGLRQYNIRSKTKSVWIEAFDPTESQWTSGKLNLRTQVHIYIDLDVHDKNKAIIEEYREKYKLSSVYFIRKQEILEQASKEEGDVSLLLAEQLQNAITKVRKLEDVETQLLSLRSHMGSTCSSVAHMLKAMSYGSSRFQFIQHYQMVVIGSFRTQQTWFQQVATELSSKEGDTKIGIVRYRPTRLPGDPKFMIWIANQESNPDDTISSSYDAVVYEPDEGFTSEKEVRAAIYDGLDAIRLHHLYPNNSSTDDDSITDQVHSIMNELRSL